MSSVVIAGDTSGTVTLDAPAVAGTTVLTLPARSGTVMVNGPAFRAFQSSAQTALTQDVDTKVLFQTENFDTNNNFSSSRFTPTVAGYYQINAGCQISGTTTYFYLVIYVNGAPYRYGSYVGVSSNNPISTASDVIYFNGSTDYVEVYAATGTSRAINSSSSATTFSGYLARSA